MVSISSLPVSAVVYICGPLDTFLNIMKLFQSEIQDPENYAIFYLDVYAESLTEGKPWQKSDTELLDPINVFKVRSPLDSLGSSSIHSMSHFFVKSELVFHSNSLKPPQRFNCVWKNPQFISTLTPLKVMQV